MQTATMARDSHPTTAATTQLRDIEKMLPLRVLSKEDWQHWITRGYVIVRQAVPSANDIVTSTSVPSVAASSNLRSENRAKSVF